MLALHVATQAPADGVLRGRALAAPRRASLRRLATPPRAAGGPLDGVEDPLLRRALQEPVAFAGGLVAGFLKLDLGAEPLADWVRRTSAAAGSPPEAPPPAAESERAMRPQSDGHRDG